VFNCGVDKRSIFTTQAQQYFFFRRLFLLNSTNTSKLVANQRRKRKDKEIVASGDQLVSIIAYCQIIFTYC